MKRPRMIDKLIKVGMISLQGMRLLFIPVFP